MNTMEDHRNQERYREDNIALVLGMWWREIVFGTVLLAVAGGVAILTLEVVVPRYEASADVAIIQTETDVSFDDRFKAVGGTQRRRVGDMRARRAAFVGLVENGNIATEVARRIEWPEEDRDLEDGTRVAKLMTSVSGRLVTIGAVTRNNQSNLIRITATAGSPKMAAAIADAWVKEYVSEVNRLYERVPQKVIDTIRTELQQTLKTYEKSQAVLENFMANNQLFRLDSQITANNETIANLYSIWQSGFDAILNKSLKTNIKILEEIYNEKAKLAKLQDAAITLRTQIEAAGDAGLVSNGTAIQLLKFQIFTSKDAMPDDLEIRFDHADRAHTDVSAQKADINAVIASLRDGIKEADRNSSELSQKLTRRFTEVEELAVMRGGFENPASSSLNSELQQNITEISSRVMYAISEISNQNQDLEAKKEALAAHRQKLENSRDLARSTYETLRNEEIELQLTAAAAPSVVRLASLAVLPEDSAWPSPALVALSAGVVGLPVMTFLAFFVNFLGIRPFFSMQGARRSERIQPPG